MNHYHHPPSHRVDSSQQQLGEADVDLGSGQLVGGQQVGQVHALCRLATAHLSFNFSHSPVNEGPGCHRKHINKKVIYIVTKSETIVHVFLLLFRTHIVEVVPGLNEAIPQGEDAAAPPREEDHSLGQRQHVVDGGDEPQCVFGNLLLQAAQSGLKQDGGYTCRRGIVKTDKTPLK